MSTTKKPAKAATESISKAQETARSAASAASEVASAYVSGVTELGRTAIGVGQEIVQETVDHGRNSLKANCLGDLAEMQAGYVQHRIESSTVHVKTLADVASSYVQRIYAPLAGLLKTSKSA